MRSLVFGLFALCATAALADERKVTLSESEFRSIIASERIAAVSQYVMDQSKSVYGKVSEAFGPAPTPEIHKPDSPTK